MRNAFFDYRFPTIALRGSEGVSLGRAYDYFANGKLQSVKSINDLARDFSNVDPKFGLNANTTVRFGMIEIGAGAVARGELQTNDALKKFVNSGIGGPVAANAADARADIIGAGYYTLPSIAAGIALPNKKDTRNTYAVGLRVKVMRAIYSHYIADATALDGQSNSLAAPELGDRDYLSKTGVGADLGIMMRPKAGSSGALSYALVIANAVRPKFDFDGTNKDDKATRVKLLSTTATAGIGYQKRGITLVGDIVDFTSSAGRADVRLGAEFVFPLNLAVRAGYAAGLWLHLRRFCLWFQCCFRGASNRSKSSELSSSKEAVGG